MRTNCPREAAGRTFRAGGHGELELKLYPKATLLFLPHPAAEANCASSGPKSGSTAPGLSGHL